MTPTKIRLQTLARFLALAWVMAGCGGGDGQSSSDAAPACHSSSDCAEPTSICDTIKGECVECLVLSDCAHKEGTVCSEARCVCPTDASCGPPACESSTDCAEPTNICDTIKGECVECLARSDCGHMEGTVCSNGQCVCPGGAAFCGPGECADLDTSSEHCGACGHACFGSCSMGACIDPWEPLPTEGAPSPRAQHVAVWTGSMMILWGGVGDSVLQDGAVFDPATWTWTPISPVNAPSPRYGATAVWTGSEMIVWGGRGSSDQVLGDGKRYDPAANQWTSMASTDAPGARFRHTAVWTGSEMIIWGGQDGAEQQNTGGRYDPQSDSWLPTEVFSTLAPRERHTAIWDPDRMAMLIYGGFGDAVALPNVFMPAGSEPGGRAYRPSDDSWTTLPGTNEPSARADHAAVFDGGGMIIFGGRRTDILGTGGRLEEDTWTSTAAAPRADHTMVWLDGPSLAVVWGGRDGNGLAEEGLRYDPDTDVWTEPPAVPLSARFQHTAVSTGEKMIVWGGVDAAGEPLGDGAVYDPSP